MLSVQYSHVKITFTEFRVALNEIVMQPGSCPMSSRRMCSRCLISLAR